ncbi:MAG: hypothetical protein HYT13_00310 [Candidatus Liptonbacteria bacterium]|nr:hypothetical protein [Candidatus Liptonbacteria bacterium]
MQERLPAPYVFTRAERPLFAEVYFPKKIVYQGTIFKALEEGLQEEVVKEYLRENVVSLMEELKGYPDILNPRQLEEASRKQPQSVSLEDALERIEMYQSRFQGWSMYEVDGIFLEAGHIDEERTQVIRLMFRFDSSLSALADEAGCGDALRIIHLWFMDHRFYRLWEQKPWDAAEKKRLLDSRSPWPARKRKFVEKHFEAAIRESVKWLDDCALFTYGYLVRNFWEIVLERGRREDEIWVTSLFGLNLNVVKRLTPSL